MQLVLGLWASVAVVAGSQEFAQPPVRSDGVVAQATAERGGRRMLDAACTNGGACPRAIEMILGEPPDFYGNCALVGSSADLSGRGLGVSIDQHGTVIRVNRVPTRENWEDLGSRVDVLFVSAIADRQPVYSKKLNGIRYASVGKRGQRGGRVKRTLHQFNQTGSPWSMLVFKRSHWRYVWPRTHYEFAQRFPDDGRGWRPERSTFPMAHEANDVDALAFHIIPRGIPTTGFQAFLTFALACESLSLYGYTGKATGDRHRINARHSLALEHRQLERIFEAALPAGDFLWQQNRHNITRSREGEDFAERMAALMQNILDKAKSGRLRYVKARHPSAT